LAELFRSHGDDAQAEPLYRRVLEAHERVLGGEHPDTLGSLNNLALIFQSQGNYAQAEPLLRRALRANERVLGKEHPDTLKSVNECGVRKENGPDR
jgi:tetratricopeptide (TPR) repeat protein